MSGPNKDFILSYSGGKDSILALYRMIERGYTPKALFTIMRHNNAGSNCHRLSKEILSSASKALDIPIYFLDLQCNIAYDVQVTCFMAKFQEMGINHCVFGDINLVPARSRSQEACDKIGMHAIFPLWLTEEAVVVADFIKLRFKAVIKSVQPRFPDSMLGQHLDKAFVKELSKYQVSVCGENGEYHSFVYDGPIFKNPVLYRLGNIVSAPPYKTIEIV